MVSVLNPRPGHRYPRGPAERVILIAISVPDPVAIRIEVPRPIQVNADLVGPAIVPVHEGR